MPFDHSHGESVAAAAEVVVDFVRSQIESGDLKPGDRLPAERELAGRIGVSRPSVRAGLRTLAAMRVVQTRHGAGTFITDGPLVLDVKPLRLLSALHGFTPAQLFEARRVLEVGVAGLAAERATAEQVAVMAEEVAGMFASAEDSQAFTMHDIRFHRAVAAGSGNPILAALVEMVSTLFFDERRQGPVRTPAQLRERAIMHRNIYHAVRVRDPRAAQREMSQHLPAKGADAAVAATPARR